jgi:hypothetical protein
MERNWVDAMLARWQFTFLRRPEGMATSCRAWTETGAPVHVHHKPAGSGAVNYVGLPSSKLLATGHEWWSLPDDPVNKLPGRHFAAKQSQSDPSVQCIRYRSEGTLVSFPDSNVHQRAPYVWCYLPISARDAAGPRRGRPSHSISEVGTAGCGAWRNER